MLMVGANKRNYNWVSFTRRRAKGKPKVKAVEIGTRWKLKYYNVNVNVSLLGSCWAICCTHTQFKLKSTPFPDCHLCPSQALTLTSETDMGFLLGSEWVIVTIIASSSLPNVNITFWNIIMKMQHNIIIIKCIMTWLHPQQSASIPR